MRGMCFITHSSMFQFIVLLFYNIDIIHVADLLIMFCLCNKYFLLITICLMFVLYNIHKLSSWIIYKVLMHVHILPTQDWLVPEVSTFSILILICYYWSPHIGINKKGLPHKHKSHHNACSRRFWIEFGIPNETIRK